MHVDLPYQEESLNLLFFEIEKISFFEPNHPHEVQIEDHLDFDLHF